MDDMPMMYIRMTIEEKKHEGGGKQHLKELKKGNWREEMGRGEKAENLPTDTIAFRLKYDDAGREKGPAEGIIRATQKSQNESIV